MTFRYQGREDDSSRRRAKWLQILSGPESMNDLGGHPDVGVDVGVLSTKRRSECFKCRSRLPCAGFNVSLGCSEKHDRCEADIELAAGEKLCIPIRVSLDVRELFVDSVGKSPLKPRGTLDAESPSPMPKTKIVNEEKKVAIFRDENLI